MKKIAEAIGLALCAVLALIVSIIAVVAVTPANNCEHSKFVWKADSSEHWQECSDCGYEIPLSRKQHLLSYGHCDCEAFVVDEDGE